MLTCAHVLQQAQALDDAVVEVVPPRSSAVPSETRPMRRPLRSTCYDPHHDEAPGKAFLWLGSESEDAGSVEYLYRVSKFYICRVHLMFNKPYPADKKRLY